jgi:DNA polymerase/3'-5' exonuclease PolX
VEWWLVSDGRIPYSDALRLAEEFRSLISPWCVRTQIVGSLRRKRATVKDIELLVEPRIEEVADGMFGDTKRVNLLRPFMLELKESGIVRDRLGKDGKAAFGDRFMRMIWKGVAVDLFVCFPPAQYGVLEIIRTGSAEFSKKLMTPKPHGFMPLGMRIEDGQLLECGQPVSTPDERAVFEALDLAFIRPENREL